MTRSFAGSVSSMGSVILLCGLTMPAFAQQRGAGQGSGQGGGQGTGQQGPGRGGSGAPVHGGGAAGHAPRVFPVPRTSGPVAATGYEGIRVSSFGVQVLGGGTANRPVREHEGHGRGAYGGAVVLGVPYGYGYASPFALGSPEEVGVGDAAFVGQTEAAEQAPQREAPRYQQQPEPEPAYVAQVQPELVNVPAPAAPVADEEAVTLIFKDGRPSEQIHNYMVTRTTLYITDRKRREIPMEQIDVAATEKANRAAGVSFRLPAK